MIEIAAYLSDGKYATRQEVQDALNLPKKPYSRAHIGLKKAGIIGLEGRGPLRRSTI